MHSSTQEHPSRTGLAIRFDPAFDDEAWPGPLGDHVAVAGEAWLGPAGLLHTLEMCLGLVAPVEPERLRAAALVPRIRAAPSEAFFRASADIDLLGTARRLLHFAEALRLHGWRGDALSPRLASLADLTREDPSAVAARLSEVEHGLTHCSVPIDTIELLVPEGELPLLWQRVLAALRARGTMVVERPLAPASARGDLAAARAPGFHPAGDGTVVLVRSPAPLEAADEIAAWLASLPDLRGTVIVAPDGVLDSALRRHGLPTTGAPASVGDDVLLQILPLVLAMGWSPPDPEKAYELLAIPYGPIPPAIARRLTAALREWPAVDGDLWREALATGLAAIPEPARREAVRARAAILFAPAEQRGRYPAVEILRRLDALEGWFVEEREAAPPVRRCAWDGPLAQCAALRALLDRSRVDDLSPYQLVRFVEEATASAPPPALFAPEAGLAAVVRPELVAGPARRVIWWGFTRDAAPPTFPDMPLTRAERASLGALGADLPDPAEVAARVARRRRRPLLQATGSLILICPRRGADGEPLYPHPLWDEIVSALGRPEHALLLERSAPCPPSPARRERTLRSLAAPRREWHVAAEVLARQPRESPSSLADLIGCPFKWAVERLGRARDWTCRGLPSLPLVLGSVAHEIVSRALSDGPSDPDDAAREAGRLFDGHAPRLAAALFRPGAEATRAELRRSCVESTRDLARLRERAGIPVSSVEARCERPGLGATLEGRLDIVLGAPPRAVVDLKWGRAKDRRAELAAGTAYQLAAYAYLVREPTGPWPAVAYYILREQRLLASGIESLPGAESVPGPGPAATWVALECAHASRWAELLSGTVVAPGNSDGSGSAQPRASGIEGGALVLEPPCRYCGAGALCGRALGAPP